MARADGASRGILRRRLPSIVFALLGIAAWLAFSAQATAAPGDASADRVLGQTDFVTGGGCDGDEVGASTLCFPAGLALDAAGDIYVADTSNSRVLRFDAPLTTGASATSVFGQPDFTTHACNIGGTSATSLCHPTGVALDAAGHLFVADRLNSRVLEYDNPLTSSVADRVLGQPDFASRLCNSNLSPTATSMCNPSGVALDSAGLLYVADGGNNRLLEYDSPLASPTANRVFGQLGFTTGACNTGGISAASLCDPEGAALDAAGSLYVADSANHRVLEYDAPLNSSSADRVFGQPTFSASACPGTTAATLCQPTGVALDAAGHLYVADSGPSRVLEYETPLTSAVANRLFGHSEFTRAGCNDGGMGASALCGPSALAIDGAGDLYVADPGNNHHRVLEYDSCFGTFGQPDNDVRGGTFGGTVPPAPAWIYDFVSAEGATGAPDACDPNDDNNGCIDTREPMLVPPRNPSNPWDFADMWVPALPASGPVSGGRNGAVLLADAAAALVWVGTIDNAGPNVYGRDYGNDINTNGVEDGAEYDRTPTGTVGLSGPPNGSVLLQDVSVIIAQVGDIC